MLRFGAAGYASGSNKSGSGFWSVKREETWMILVIA